MTGKIVVYCLLLLCATTLSCTFLADEAITIGMLKIGDPTLQSSLGTGAPSHGIKDAWVYADEQIVGVFGLPAAIPIESQEAPISFQIRAGISPNGNNSSSIEFPFFDEIVTQQNINQGANTTVPLNFNYKREAVFDFIADFEQTNIFIDEVDGNVQTILQRKETDSPFGSFAGIIELQGQNDAIEVTHTARYLGANNKRGSVFLEFDYKGDENFFVGTILEKGSNLVKAYKILITPSVDWKHFYLDLTDEISKSDVVSYKVVFSSTLSPGKTKSTIYLDNMKLIHF